MQIFSLIYVFFVFLDSHKKHLFHMLNLVSICKTKPKSRFFVKMVFLNSSRLCLIDLSFTKIFLTILQYFIFDEIWKQRFLCRDYFYETKPNESRYTYFFNTKSFQKFLAISNEYHTVKKLVLLLRRLTIGRLRVVFPWKLLPYPRQMK